MDNLSFFQRILAKKIKKIYQKRNKKLIPFSELKNILLVIDLDTFPDIKDIAKASDQLSKLNKDVRIIWLTKNKKSDQEGEIIFYKRFLFSIKFWGNSTDVFNEDFDLIIGYSAQYSLILQYFVNLLNSKLIILPFYQEPDFADISFKTKDGTLQSLVMQAIDFLKIIKR